MNTVTFYRDQREVEVATSDLEEVIIIEVQAQDNYAVTPKAYEEPLNYSMYTSSPRPLNAKASKGPLNVTKPLFIEADYNSPLYWRRCEAVLRGKVKAEDLARFGHRFHEYYVRDGDILAFYVQCLINDKFPEHLTFLGCGLLFQVLTSETAQDLYKYHHHLNETPALENLSLENLDGNFVHLYNFIFKDKPMKNKAKKRLLF